MPAEERLGEWTSSGNEVTSVVRGAIYPKSIDRVSCEYFQGDPGSIIKYYIGLNNSVA